MKSSLAHNEKGTFRKSDTHRELKLQAKQRKLPDNRRDTFEKINEVAIKRNTTRSYKTASITESEKEWQLWRAMY